MYYQQHPDEDPLQASSSPAVRCPSKKAPDSAAQYTHARTHVTSQQDHVRLVSEEGLSGTRLASRGKPKKCSAGRRPAPTAKLRIRPVSTKSKLRTSRRGKHASEFGLTTGHTSKVEAHILERALSPKAALAKKWVQPRLSFAYTQRTTFVTTSELIAAKQAITEGQAPKQPQRATSCSAPAPAADDTAAAPAPGPAQQTCLYQDTELHLIEPGEPLNIATWNVMGLTGVQEDLRHLLNLKRDGNSIDIMVLTETKLIPQHHCKKWLKPLFEGWQAHFSSNSQFDSAPKLERIRTGSGGVIIPCRKSGLGSAFQREVDVPERLAGDLAIVKSSQHKLWVVGIYMPCNDQQKRSELYDFLSIIAKDALHSGVEMVMAGDWNAAWQSTDRSTGTLTSVDILHGKAIEQMGMCPFQIKDRRKTFGCMLPDGASRIDDVLISSCSKLDKGSPEEVLPMGERSDHLPLKITLTLPKSPSSSTSDNGTEDNDMASKVPQGFQRPLAPGQKQMLRCHHEGQSFR